MSPVVIFTRYVSTLMFSLTQSSASMAAFHSEYHKMHLFEWTELQNHRILMVLFPLSGVQAIALIFQPSRG